MAGYAACLHDDLQQARDLYGDLPVLGVNGAGREVDCFGLYSKHPERFEIWARHQIRRFGPVELHGGRESEHIDYCWPVWGGGGSMWDARKTASLMGFDLVVLCGCPLVPGPYVGNHNIGGFMHRGDVVDGFRRSIEKDADWHEGVVSMSGWTKEIFG